MFGIGKEMSVALIMWLFAGNHQAANVLSNLNHHTAINCRAITGCPYGTNQSPVGTRHNSPEIHFRDMFPGKRGYFSGLILSMKDIISLNCGKPVKNSMPQDSGHRLCMAE